MRNGSLLLVSDGSYQPSLTHKRGATAWSLECTSTSNRVSCMLGSTTSVAHAYSSKLTGIYSTMAFISAVCEFYKVTAGNLKFYCDWKSGITWVSTTYIKTAPTCKHADLVHLIRQLSANTPLTISFQHIHGHQDANAIYVSLICEVKLNIICYSIA